jgi:hypothetical protein
MTALLDNTVFDGGLTALHNAATTIWINSTQATTYTQASSTYALGSNVVAAGSCVGAAAGGTPSGRQVTVAAITAGNIASSGTAAFYSITDGSILYAANSLSSSQAVTAGNTFTLASFLVTLRGTS